jgi:hypothetical protein
MNERSELDKLDDKKGYDDDMCVICLNNKLTTLERCTTQCNHIMCTECLDQVLDNQQSCPMCRSDITSYTCDGIQNRLLYKEKKRVRHIQTIIDNRYIPSKVSKVVLPILLTTNILVGYFLIQCKIHD